MCALCCLSVCMCVSTQCCTGLHEETGSMLELTRPVGSTSSQINCTGDQPLLQLCQIRALRQCTHRHMDMHTNSCQAHTHSWLPTAPETSEHISALRWELQFVCAFLCVWCGCVWAVTGSVWWLLEHTGWAAWDLCSFVRMCVRARTCFFVEIMHLVMFGHEWVSPSVFCVCMFACSVKCVCAPAGI